jgi:hypothetical protein
MDVRNKIPEGKYIIFSNKIATATLLFGRVFSVNCSEVNVKTEITVMAEKHISFTYLWVL